MDIDANVDQPDERRHGVPGEDAEPTKTAPDVERPSSSDEGLQSDPGPAKPHGDPITDIDDELRRGRGGND
ncbi:MAG: hypothetical protein ABJA93_01715 [Sporichthyaceae bacterium]